MPRSYLLGLAASAALVGCTNDYSVNSCKDIDGNCLEFGADDPEGLLEGVQLLEAGDTVILGEGTFTLGNQVTTRATGITILGQGMDLTTLDFASAEAQTNGIDHVGDDFLVQDLTIIDAKKDGLRVEDSDGVTIRRVRATWTNELDTTNGAYGLYPVKVSNVLMEDSEAFNSSDAGIYVGQCQNAIVRNNLATGNVAGIEIENTQYADVYGNTATGNTGGLLIFDLPGNPVIGHDIKVHDNDVTDNNIENFAPGGTVGVIPPGTGTIILASRRLELYDNLYSGNITSDIAMVSGLAIQSNPAQWAIAKTSIVGDTTGLTLLAWDGTNILTPVDAGYADATHVLNFRTEELYLHGNEHVNYGTDPQGELGEQDIGFLIKLVYGDDLPVDAVLYDGINEPAFTANPTDPNDSTQISNVNHICTGPSDTGTWATLDLEHLAEAAESILNPPTVADLYRPASPFAPYDCTGFTAGPLADVTVE